MRDRVGRTPSAEVRCNFGHSAAGPWRVEVGCAGMPKKWFVVGGGFVAD